jgi:protoporphyrinogen oxidase
MRGTAVKDVSPEPRTQVDTLILGAGLTGLSCAYHLQDPARYRLIEKEREVGGLAKTRKRPGGFLCDGTGHWLHLRNPYTKEMVAKLMDGNLSPRARRARIFSKGVYTLYPFQANTFGLPKEVVSECLIGLIKTKYETTKEPPKNYLEWIRAEFGDGICKHFMEPYNGKIYGVPLDSLAANFAEKYIPRPPIDSVVKGALGLSPEALGYNAEFVYPKKGGIGALSESLHAKIERKAEHGRMPKAIDVQNRIATMEDGERFSYRHLVNTIPLPELIRRCLAGNASAVPSDVVDASALLRANSVLYFDVAIKGTPKEHQNYHWIYLPESDFKFYRVGSYSAVEPSLAPEGTRSYYVEFGHYGTIDPAKFEQPLIDGLRRLGILDDSDEILFMIPNVLDPAYVLFDHHYEAARHKVLAWLSHTGIVSVGRYGRWQYNAMEDALLEGKEAAEVAQGVRSLS